jgi:sugar phosphate isomerase/epimerase
MTARTELSRRSFLALAAAAPLAAGTGLRAQGKRPVVGLELYSVRDELTKDLMGTVRAVAKMGYETVEFYSPYYQWTPAYAKEVRALLDDLGITCMSTHNGANALAADGLGKAIELNQVLGSTSIVMASAGKVEGVDGWKGIADRLSAASEKLRPLKMTAGFHNHALEFRPLPAGPRPMDILAENTPRDMVLQLDVGTCVEAKVDPVAWIKANPGRIHSIHCKDWSPEEGKGYHVLFGEGVSPWKEIFAAAESVGGVTHYLIEQEGSRFPSIETAQRCLATYKAMRG